MFHIQVVVMIRYDPVIQHISGPAYCDGNLARHARNLQFVRPVSAIMQRLQLAASFRAVSALRLCS